VHQLQPDVRIGRLARPERPSSGEPEFEHQDAEAHAFERLLSLRNDVGLLAEEYDSHAQRQVENFPQAFSHVALIGTALNLQKVGPAQRSDPETPPVSISTRSVLREGVAK